MNVLIVTNMYPTPSNPVYGIFILKQVESLEKQGVRCHVYFLNGKDNKSNYLKAIRELAKLLCSESFDIVHSHHSYCNYVLYAAMRIARISLPTVTTFHEGEAWTSNAGTPCKSLLQQLRWKHLSQYARESKYLKRKALIWATAVIAVDRKMMNTVFLKGKTPTVFEIPCGVDIESFQPLPRAECRDLLGLPRSQSIIFFPSDPKRREKGFHLLRNAVHILDDTIYPRLQVVAAGGIPNEKMTLYYNAADVVVHPSLYEASPTAVKEAMACNVPIVASTAGDTVRMLDDVPGHYLCSLDPPDLAKKIREAIGFGRKTEGRKRILSERLDLKSIASKIQEVYECVIKINHSMNKKAFSIVL